MKRIPALLTFVVLAVTLLVLPSECPVRAAGVRASDASPLLPYAGFLAEFSNRRRANVYFENQQSIFHGVQVHWVNVGEGNLTFVRRDLVTVGRLPIMAARLYDSASHGNSDFGTGWRLTAAETVFVHEGVAILTDDTGSEIRFIATASGFALERDFPSDLLDLKRSSERKLTARYRTGLVKEFALIGSAYRLAQVTDRNGNSIRLIYAGERLNRMENGGHWVRFLRNAQGRIRASTDEQNRLVRYRYDKSGRLAASIDASGNIWDYTYDDTGLLRRASDPEGRENFRALYGEDGKVRDVELPSGHVSYRYDDAERVTSVTDRRNLVARYWQDGDGITVRAVNPLGDESSIVLDGARNVESVKLNGTLVHAMEYDTWHRLLFRRTTTANGDLAARYDYDPATGELERIKYGNGTERAFTFDVTGNVRSATETNENYEYEYSPAGDVTQFADGEMIVKVLNDKDGLIRRVTDAHGDRGFEYSGSGRLAEVKDSGLRATMKYNPLGLRQTLDFSDGRKSRFIYDSAANLRATRSMDGKGTASGEALSVGDDYEVRKVTLEGRDGTEDKGGGERSFEYDDSENLIRAEMPSGTYSFEYDGLNRFIAVIRPGGERLQYTYAPGERSLVDQADLHSTVSMSSRWNAGATFENGLSVRALRTRASQYGSVSFANGGFGLAGGDEIVLPGAAIEDAFGRLGLLHPAQGYGESEAHFYAPANRVFLPPEYAFLNCCICGGGAAVPDLPCMHCPPPDPPVPPSPHISSIVPASAQIGATVPVTISGSHFGTLNDTVVNISGGGMTASVGSVSAETIQATFAVAGGVTPGDRGVTVVVTGVDSKQRTSNSYPFTVAQPVPVNFHLTSAMDEGGGTLPPILDAFFAWGSSSGNPADLSSCSMREYVSYPSSNNAACPNNAPPGLCYYGQSPPWPPKGAAGSGYPNPTSPLPGPANGGTSKDVNSVQNLAFVKPYTSNSFPATQYTQYSCDGGQTWPNVYGPITITRSVSKNPSNIWVVTVSRSDTTKTSTTILPIQ